MAENGNLPASETPIQQSNDRAEACSSRGHSSRNVHFGTGCRVAGRLAYDRGVLARCGRTLRRLTDRVSFGSSFHCLSRAERWRCRSGTVRLNQR
jgi:hypothetical protein